MNKKIFTSTPFLTAVALMSVFAIIFIASLIIGNSGLNSKNDLNNEKNISFPVIYNNPTLPYDYELNYEIQTETNKYLNNGEELIFLSASFPLIDTSTPQYQLIQNSINEFITEKLTIKSFEITLVNESYENAKNKAEGFIPFEFVTDCESICIKGNYLSLLFRISRTTSISEPERTYKSMCFDLTTGKAMTFAEFISQSSFFAYDYIKNVFSQDIKNRPQLYYSNAEEYIDTCIDLLFFYLTEDKLILYFEPEVISPSVYGMSVITVPYEHIVIESKK